MPSRLSGAELTSSDDADLSAAIVKLLRLDGVDLRGSTEARLRHKIDEAVAVYAIRLRKSEQTIDGLCKKLDELEDI
jgi:hypothetical protein